jgi:hypothetical protein
MPSRFFHNFFVIIILTLWVLPLHAQEFFPTQRKIEKTRIQFQKQSWKYITNDFFEVYFFGKNENLARQSLSILEAESPKMLDLLGYSSFQKVKIFIYPSQDDLFQSNSGISFENQEEIKINNLEKLRIEIAFQYDLNNFKKQLLKSLANVYVHDMLFSGSVKDVLQNSLFMNVSEWYLKGLSAYLALGETSEMNQFMFQAIRNNKIRKINVATGLEAELLGQSIWSYIVKMYGKQPISNIVNLTRIIRNEQSSVASTLKKPFGKFLQDWYKYYYNQNNFIVNNVSSVSYLDQILHLDLAKGKRIGTFQLSPDGNWLVYSIQTNTKFQTFVYHLPTKKNNNIFNLTINDPLGMSSVVGPKFSWGKGNSLFILYSEEGKTWLNNYAPIIGNKFSSKILAKRELKDLNCLQFEMAPSNQKLLLKVLRNGQVDLGTYDLRRNRFTPITQDRFEEPEAHWTANGNSILYVSEQIADSTMTEKDKVGMNALYEWNAEEGVAKQLFSIKGEIRNFVIEPDSIVQFLGNNKNGRTIINYSFKDQKVKEKLVDVGAWQMFQKSTNYSIVQRNDMLEQYLTIVPNDAFSRMSDFEFVPERENLDNTIFAADKDSVVNDLINRRNAQRKARLERNNSLKAKTSLSSSKSILNYENSFANSTLNGYFKSDPIRGIGYALQANMNDLMENHLLQAGFFLGANLKSSDLWGEYSYVENRTDWSLRFDRKVLNQEIDYYNSQRIRFNRIELKALYPFDLRNKLAVSGIYTLNRQIDQNNFRIPENVMGYAGLKTEYQFDNTLQLGENLQEGQRVWASAEIQKMTMEPGGFLKFKFDFRKYLGLKEWMYVYTRFSASHAIGLGNNSNVPQTILGGMDNWLFQTREARTTANPLGVDGLAQRDIFMSDMAGNMRGFGINKMSGNSHLLWNVELHIPVKKIISQDQERSDFINNLQLIGFSDIGCAWSGSSPFSRTNGFNTNEYGGKTNPFRATVTDFRNPFLIGFGFGARTKIMGYYVKLDYAIGMSDGQIMPSMTYLSLGKDF